MKMEKQEALARMWVMCDPNRDRDGLDEPMTGAHGELKDKPRWHWFIPRAQASEKFLREHGYEIVAVKPQGKE